MTAPEMVSVIAAALSTHAPRIAYYSAEEGHVSCHGCDGNWASFDGFYTHQARAVLAAISEAGAVEWGWEYQSIIGGDYGKRITRNWGVDRPLTREESQAHVDAMNKNTRRPDVARLVSRITGPWTAVE